jgi:hypothetical protein
MANNKDDRHLKEAQKVDYGVRSIFIQRSLKGLNYDRFFQRIKSLKPEEFEWKEFSQIGISDRAWNCAKEKGINPLFLFCHPKVITSDPSLVIYYRGIAGIPLKAIKKVAFDTTKIESKKIPLQYERSSELSKVINEFISRILEEDEEYSLQDAGIMFYATVGANLDGQWRNVKGFEIASLVKRMIFEFFLSKKLIKSILLQKGKESKPHKNVTVNEIKGFILKNFCRIEFGSEPDISFIDKKGMLTGMVEVKGGLDEAGALERYGAAKKTFDEVLNKNPRAFTIYLASCITPTVRKRIEADRAVRKIFNLTNVFFDEKEKLNFLEEIRWWMRV